MRILGIDPGTATLGWAIIEKKNSQVSLVAYDAMYTKPNDSEEQRLLILHREFSKLIHTYSPHAVSIEQLYFATNAKTAIAVAQARGVILLASAQNNIPVVSYSPLHIKKTITGDGKADKRQVQSMLTKLLPLTIAPKPDDAADAIAIALTHAYTNKFI
jgi:crossover junction endodeoxyribonuclease RuvC